MWARYPPTPPFHCGENEIQVSLISSTSVGATPTPATNFGRCSGCRSVKPVSQTTVGSDDWSVTSTSHHLWIRSSTSQSNPLSAGRLRVQVPSGPPFSRSVAQSLERPAWDREAAGGNPAVPTNFKLLPWSNISGIRLLNGTMQVGILPAAPLPGGVKVARRFVKPHGVGASPTLAASFRV